jgi:hypothetical protein
LGMVGAGGTGTADLKGGEDANNVGGGGMEKRQAGSTETGEKENGGKTGLRLLNEQVGELMQKRKAELDQGIVDSDRRIRLSGLKPIADQFNFIGKVAADLEKLSGGIGRDNSTFADIPNSR